MSRGSGGRGGAYSGEAFQLRNEGRKYTKMNASRIAPKGGGYRGRKKAVASKWGRGN